jgi:hypothetical protein
MLSKSYLPQVLDYSEYDFRNSQAQESLEDAFWESNHSAFSHEDYVLSKKNFKMQEYFNKEKLLYNSSARILEKKTYSPSSHLLLTSKKIVTTVLSDTNDFKRLDWPVLVERLNVGLVRKGYFKLLHYLYHFINEPTFFKKMILFLNSIRLDVHSTGFNPLDISYFSSARNNLLLFYKIVSDYHIGIKGLVFSDIEKTKSINGIRLEKFSYEGMGRDKYR